MSAPGRLQGRTALITGSSSGLGRCIALAFAAEGASVCCVDLYPQPRRGIDPATNRSDDFNIRKEGLTTHDAITEMGGKAVFVRADVTKGDEVEAAVAECVRHFGRLDIMCNNAGISVESTHERRLRVHETSEEDFDKTLAINTRAVFLGCKYACAQFLRQDPLTHSQSGKERSRGWIVNTASVQGFVPYYGTPCYAASKGAVVMLTKAVALDYARDRIHCNALCPGFLITSMTQNLHGDPRRRREIERAHPWGSEGGGMGDPEDVARAAVFLASDDVGWITGVPLVVDGGFMLHA